VLKTTRVANPARQQCVSSAHVRMGNRATVFGCIVRALGIARGAMWVRVRNPLVETRPRVWAAVVAVVGFMICSCVPRHSTTSRPDPIVWAVENVPVGTQRGAALNLLADALCHVECPQFDGEVHDLFFYKACDFDRGTVVIVGSRPVSDTLQVYQVGRRDRNALHHWYDACLAESPPQAPSDG
jgi:hypothetical protein